MFSGIAAGFFSALFMSVSYVFSRAFIRKYKDPVRLSIFSQLVMTCGGLAALITSLFLSGSLLTMENSICIFSGRQPHLSQDRQVSLSCSKKWRQQEHPLSWD